MNQIELFNDHFQNFKVYGIPKAQLIIADPPYNLGVNAYASNPSWYVDGDNKNGESDKAGKEFFDTDKDFRPAEFMHFCSQMLVKEPKESGKAPCMIVFCEFEQQFKYIELGKRYGFNHYINLVFRKNFSAQVLKANMKIVGNCNMVFYYTGTSCQSSTMGVVWFSIAWIGRETPGHRKFIPHKSPSRFWNALSRYSQTKGMLSSTLAPEAAQRFWLQRICCAGRMGLKLKKSFTKPLMNASCQFRHNQTYLNYESKGIFRQSGRNA